MLVPILAAAAACGSIQEPTAPDAAPAADGAPDAAPPTCDPTAPFDPPAPLAGLSDPANVEGSLSLLPDERTTFVTFVAGGGNDYNVDVAMRASPTDPFGTPVAIGVDTTSNEFDPAVSSDGLTLIFGSTRDGTDHLYVAARASTLTDFASAAPLAGLGSDPSSNDKQPALSADGQELYFVSNRAGGLGGEDIYRATRIGDGFGNATLVTELSSATDEWMPVISADRRTVYLSRGADIWTSHRTSVDAPFPAPTPVTELDTAGNESPGWLSADNCRLYFSRDGDEYLATRAP